MNRRSFLTSLGVALLSPTVFAAAPAVQSIPEAPRINTETDEFGKRLKQGGLISGKTFYLKHDYYTIEKDTQIIGCTFYTELNKHVIIDCGIGVENVEIVGNAFQGICLDQIP